MAQGARDEIRLLELLSEGDCREIAALESACREYDGVTFKFELEYKMEEAAERGGRIGESNEFLYYSNGMLAGYLGICCFGGDTMEINGMTHPEYRRRGIFKRLFALACDEIARRKPEGVLLLSDRNSASGLAFIRSTGAQPDHAEFDMLWNGSTAGFKAGKAVELQETGREGVSISYSAMADGKPVGQVRLDRMPGEGGIYGVEVPEELRGQGYGRALLQASVLKLRDEGMQRIRLQVDESNTPALNLYLSCGFEAVSTMDYYAFSL